MAQQNDRTANLLVRARNLDRNALEQIHEQYYPVVYRYVRFRLEDEEICAHLSGQVFSALLASLQQKRKPKGDLLQFFIDTAAGLVDNYLSERPKPRLDSLISQLNQGAASGAEDFSTKRNLFIQRAVQTLPTDEQHFLALRFSQNLTLGQLGDIAGKKAGAVRSLQWRALHSLYRAFAGKTTP